MLQKLLEFHTGRLTDAEFKEIMDLTTTDILINRIAFNNRTSLGYLLYVAIQTHLIIQKIKKTAA